MALDPKKLEKCVDLAGGMRRARVSGVRRAGAGQDRGASADLPGRAVLGAACSRATGSIAKRIFALAGEHTRQTIKVRVAVAKSGGPIQAGILGTLGTALCESGPEFGRLGRGSGKSKPRSIESRTLRTGVSKSNGGSVAEICQPLGENGPLRTLRTPLQYSRVYLEKEPLKEVVHVSALKEFGEGVRSVREGEGVEQPPKEAGKGEKLPYLDPSGGLVIPF